MQPRVPFCAAEEHVDFAQVDNLILAAREQVEQRSWTAARAYAFSMYVGGGIPALRHWDRLRLNLALSVSSVFVAGYEQVIQELTSLRRAHGKPALDLPSVGSTAGREIFNVAAQAAIVYTEHVAKAYERYNGQEDEWVLLEKRSRQLLHNIVLELVGRVLNLGRTHAATGAPRPLLAAIQPALWAMRSEQLDTNTCDPCETLHGRTAIVGSAEYFSLLPPNNCLGRGRCRGIMVYADDPEDLVPAPVKPLLSVA